MLLLETGTLCLNSPISKPVAASRLWAGGYVHCWSRQKIKSTEKMMIQLLNIKVLFYFTYPTEGTAVWVLVGIASLLN